MSETTIDAAQRHPDLHAEHVVVTGDRRSHTFSGPIPIYESDDHWTVLVHDGLDHVREHDVLSAWNNETLVRRGRVTHFAVDKSSTFTYFRMHRDLF